MYRHFIILTLLFSVNLYADLVADGYVEIRQHHYTTARVFWAKACDNGNAEGCYNLGMMYDYGDGVNEDRHTASSFYIQACDLGNDLACEEYKD